MGAVMWAWRQVARRNRGEWEGSTRVAVERGAGGMDWLPPAGAVEWSGRPMVTAIAPGSAGAWVMAWVKWQGPERVRQRKGGAAWRARMGGMVGWRARYTRWAEKGLRRVRPAHREQWSRWCEEVGEGGDGGKEDGVSVVRIVSSTDGTKRVRAVTDGAVDDARARVVARAMTRAGERMVAERGAEVAKAGAAARPRRGLRRAAGDWVRTDEEALRRMRVSFGGAAEAAWLGDNGATATAGGSAGAAGAADEWVEFEVSETEEAMEREMLAFGDG